MILDSLRPGQRECAEHLDGATLVSAGAGSGKTFTLTKRIGWALTPGSGQNGAPFIDSIDEALIITFTEKAAGEIKDRVRSTLREEGRTDEALKVDGSWISTIHSMCGRILREHALALGLDPAFRIIGRAEEDAYLSLALDTELEASLTEAGSPYAALYEEYNSDDVTTYVKKILNEAAHLSGGLSAMSTGPAIAFPGELARELLGALEEVEQADIAQNQIEAREAIDKLNDAFAADDQLGAFLDVVPTIPKFAKSRKKGFEEASAAVTTLRNLINEARLFCDQVNARPLLDLLLKLASAVDARFAELKRADGVMTQNDIVRLTLNAFETQPSIAARYADRFKLVMVDEFQDTNQLQIDLIRHMAGEHCCRLCTVGDSQQSIYRFLGADVNVYLNYKRDMSADDVGANYVELDENFRSHADVLSFVRTVCNQEGFFAEPFLDLNVPIIDGESAHSEEKFHGKHRLNMILAEGAKIDEARHKAAEALADDFAALRDAGHTAEDMVVLMRSMKQVGIYADALRARGFDCVVSGGSGFFQTDEVKLCQAALAVLAGARDSESLFSLLASDVLPVTSADLLNLSTHIDGDIPRRHSLSSGILDRDMQPDQASPLLKHAIDVLWRAFDRVGTMDPSAVLRRLIIESGWMARMQNAGASGMAQAANVMKFIELVHDAETDTHFDMARLCVHMKQMESDQVKPGVLVGDAGDAVRFMTIHASKGLGFPIVAIVEFDSKEPAGDAVSANTRIDTCYLGLKRSSDARLGGIMSGPPTYEHLFDDMVSARDVSAYSLAMANAGSRESQLEKNRLFYVAATRACEAVYFVAPFKRSLSGMAACISQGFTGADNFPDEDAEFACTGGGTLYVTHAKDIDDGESEASVRATRTVDIPVVEDAPIEPLLTRSARADFYSYSSIAPHDAPAASAEPSQNQPAAGVSDQPTDNLDAAPHSDADKATEFGSALHLMCEWLALNPQVDEEAIDAKLAVVVRQFRLMHADRLAEAFGRWRTSDVCAEAFDYPRVQPEVPFCTDVDGEVLEGEIDLLCTDGSGAAFIVDYKTGGSDSETREQLHEKHLLQAQCYAYATLKAGYARVALRFVRVERNRAGMPDQPDVVEYSFTDGDCEKLAAIVRKARAAALDTTR